MRALTKPYVPAASGTAAVKLIDLQESLGNATAAVTGLTASQIAALDWGDVGSLSEGLALATRLEEWLTAWRAAQ